MNHSGALLSDFLQHYADRGEPLVLATIVETLGSTYRKAGAQMLIAGDGRAAGLLSGGCLEADLMERAGAVLQSGMAARVEYDTRSSDDLIWGIGLGCEGAMSILLTRLDSANGYQPCTFIEQCRRDGRAASIAIVTRSSNAAIPLGAAYWPQAPLAIPPMIAAALGGMAHAAPSRIETSDVEALVIPVELPPRLLVLGAGPDAMPLVEIAASMGWCVTVLDHRPAYAAPERFPRARRVQLNPAGNLAQELKVQPYDAAVVMSHHLLSDQAYLTLLADSAIPYIGLLGPAPRRARLMSEIGAKAELLKTRLYGPIGLDIGAKTPETIALAIVSEIQAALTGRPGGSFSRKA
jgi:xanthine/CO dehydrogenase XdhC/CoxF family maturation factor